MADHRLRLADRSVRLHGDTDLLAGRIAGMLPDLLKEGAAYYDDEGNLILGCADKGD
ncbi:MAG: hypothetical protein JWO67_2640 [Streptosporangiaceae bacterium]|nr:hypothetical protein [Streptosporangiaceae bacterium]